MSSQNPSPENLKRMTQEELDHVVKLHTKFIKSQRGGMRAILKFVDISDLETNF